MLGYGRTMQLSEESALKCLTGTKIEKGVLRMGTLVEIQGKPSLCVVSLPRSSAADRVRTANGDIGVA